MALFDYEAEEVLAKVVYYGPDQAGKTTNLLRLHAQLPAAEKGELVHQTTETSRTLGFDFAPPETGDIRGLRLRIQLCCIMGAASTTGRRAVLRGADGVVFVADSRAEALEADVQSLDSLYRNLIRNRVDLLLPMVVQYNKRDQATALPLETLDAKLNSRKLPSLEAVAIQGSGVEETLRAIVRLCFRRLAARYAASEAGPAEARPAFVPAPHGGRRSTSRSMARASLPTRPAAPDPQAAATPQPPARDRVEKPAAPAAPRPGKSD